MFKKKDQFLETLYEIAQNVYASAQFFNNFKIESQEGVQEFTTKLKEFETRGDEYIHELIIALNKSFITSIEREDILNLAVTLDDVLDGIEACASRFYMFEIFHPNEIMVKFGQNIEASSLEVLHAMDLLRNRKLLDMRQYIIRINDLEKEGDQLLRHGVYSLFKESNDAIEIMKVKEIYEILEKVSDSCEDVADTLETIIMRNS